jgi:outer membrane biosynthesis protein TonB
MGLDQKAVETVSQWRFAPGTKDGESVAVELTVETAFHLY